MSIHIGKIIHDLIKSKGIKVKTVAKTINVSESALYKIYKRRTIDIDKIIKFSKFLDTNLFLYYLEQEPLKSMFRKDAEKLNDEIKNLTALLEQKTKRISELEGINSSQQKILTLLEKAHTDFNIRSDTPTQDKKKRR
jgi:transcriptional regulator with XRE-family HTH domain